MASRSLACSLPPLLTLPHPPTHPLTVQLLESSGVAAYSAQSASLNASLAALPDPLLDVTIAAQVQLQALGYYEAATTWIIPNATAGGA